MRSLIPTQQILYRLLNRYYTYNYDSSVFTHCLIGSYFKMGVNRAVSNVYGMNKIVRSSQVQRRQAKIGTSSVDNNSRTIALFKCVLTTYKCRSKIIGKATQLYLKY